MASETLMRTLVVLSGLLLASASSATVWAQASGADDAANFVVSEFRKFSSLQLIDCIAGYDTALSQAGNDPNSALNVVETQGIIAYMSQALNQKEGRGVTIEEVREGSSFHVSGTYLRNGSAAQQAYQLAIVDFCGAQIGQIARRAAERAGQR